MVPRGDYGGMLSKTSVMVDSRTMFRENTFLGLLGVRWFYASSDVTEP